MNTNYIIVYIAPEVNTTARKRACGVQEPAYGWFRSFGWRVLSLGMAPAAGSVLGAVSRLTRDCAVGSSSRGNGCGPRPSFMSDLASGLPVGLKPFAAWY